MDGGGNTDAGANPDGGRSPDGGGTGTDSGLADAGGPTTDGGIVALVLGSASTCAAYGGGARRCWGRDEFSTLGDFYPFLSDGGCWLGSLSLPEGPVDPFEAPPGLPAVGADFDCSLVDGGVLCWGAGFFGALGNGQACFNPLPLPVLLDAGVPLEGVTALFPGGGEVCATTAGGPVCWGNNQYGEMGVGDTALHLYPMPLLLPAALQRIAVGGTHACALAGGSLYCWGENTSGEAGQPLATFKVLQPTAVPGLDDGGISDALISLGYGHSCIVPSNGPKAGQALCWGYNNYGQLGGGPGASVVAPNFVQPFGTQAIDQLALGYEFSCAVYASGGTWCLGNNQYGERGNPAAGVAPAVPVGLDTQRPLLKAGFHHVCALLDGGVLCWGANDEDEAIGPGDGGSVWVPTPVQGL